jgi:maltose alpha-D-glucosyltransferase/alpha-amylase
VIKGISDGLAVPTARGTLRFTPTGACREHVGEDVGELNVSRLHTQSTNTSVTLTSAKRGDRLFLKCYRRVRPGVNPEYEVGRFLTEVARFPHCVPLAGSIEYSAPGQELATLGLLQAYVPNQGDGWSYTLGYLERYLEDQRSVPQASSGEKHGAYLTLMQALATRTAELHRAFAARSGDPAFEPEPFSAEDFAAWKARVRKEAEETFALLESKKDAHEKIRPLLAERARALARIDACAAPSGPALKTRHHGDYHLGQVLLANNDFVIIDFEGEPSRPLEEGRRKHSPLRDVAGMLRSFNYAKWSALLRAREAEPNADKLIPELESWEAAVREAFLRAYAAATQGSELYRSFDDVRGLLELAELEKVLYELRYELNNRPAWLQTPLQGLLALMERT